MLQPTEVPYQGSPELLLNLLQLAFCLSEHCSHQGHQWPPHCHIQRSFPGSHHTWPFSRIWYSISLPSPETLYPCLPGWHGLLCPTGCPFCFLCWCLCFSPASKGCTVLGFRLWSFFLSSLTYLVVSNRVLNDTYTLTLKSYSYSDLFPGHWPYWSNFPLHLDVYDISNVKYLKWTLDLPPKACPFSSL